MKNFSFNINNFYSIFDHMPDDKKNIDSLLDNKIKKSLYSNTSADFSFELMKRVELQKEFAKEDIKTDKMVKYIIGAVIFFLASFTFLFTFVLYNNKTENESGFFSTLIERFTYFIEYTSSIITQTFGFAFNFQTSLIILLIMICVFLFSFGDKIIFKKSLK